MTPEKGIAARDEANAARRPWTAPSARRLATSAAEAGDTAAFDGLEIPS